MTAKIAQLERFLELLQVAVEFPASGKVQQRAALVLLHAGDDEFRNLDCVVAGSDHAAASPGQHAGTLDDVAQDRRDVKALADAQAGRGQPGQTVPEGLHLRDQFTNRFQFTNLAGPAVRRCPAFSETAARGSRF